MSPQWFAIDGIPYAEMWDDARSWLPIVLSGQVNHGVFWYNNDLATVAAMELTIEAVEAPKRPT